jgi:sec-independent protein translocase protein TatA
MELLVVLIIALFVLGPKRLPEVGRSVGKGLREFRGALGGAPGASNDGFGSLAWGDDDDDPFSEERRREEEERFARVQREEERAAREAFAEHPATPAPEGPAAASPEGPTREA